MSEGRFLTIEVGGSEDAPTTFARDQLMLLRAADEGGARARIWRRDREGLLLGRFHRADPGSFAWSDDAVSSNGLSRRMSGGRIVPAGPGVVCVNLVAPTVDWFEVARTSKDGTALPLRSLRPEQVLNRAIRPLLAMLRSDGVEAFYPGRDLVTVKGRTVAHASFTVLRDGAAMVEMHVAERAPFSNLAALLDAHDPAGIAGVERDALASSVALSGLDVAGRDDDAWAEHYATFAGRGFACETRVENAAELRASVTTAHASAARDFLRDPGLPEEESKVAAAVGMLGVVECAARFRGDRVTGLRITGDLIAPFHTLEDISNECEGEPFRPANIRTALARALARPRSFVLGIRDLDELILRLA